MDKLDLFFREHSINRIFQVLPTWKGNVKFEESKRKTHVAENWDQSQIGWEQSLVKIETSKRNESEPAKLN